MRPERARWEDLIEVLDHDLQSLRTLTARLEQWLPKDATLSSDSPVSYAISTVLHHLYNAIENIFRQTTRVFREVIAESDQWHRTLLGQMLSATADRPAVFDVRFRPLLDELLRFRHRVRHSYDYDLDGEKVQRLAELWRAQSAAVIAAVEGFRAGILAERDLSSS